MDGYLSSISHECLSWWPRGYPFLMNGTLIFYLDGYLVGYRM
jgi:hypothetical protein